MRTDFFGSIRDSSRFKKKAPQAEPDAGYAAPFTEALPLDLPEDQRIPLGPDPYVLKARTNHRFPVMELYRSGKLIHGYHINPGAREISEFSQLSEESFTRMDREHFIRIYNMTFTESHGNVSKRTSMNSFEQLTNTIHDRFRIPAPLSVESLEGLQMRTNG